MNMGPQHPSTHGVFRCVLKLDGEYVTGIENHTGYLHRGLEKLAESRTYTQFIPYTDRLDYVSGLMNNHAYVMAVEKLMPDLEIPERAEFIRVILAEMQRIVNHMLYIGCFALDVAGFTGWFYAFRDREYLLDLLEEVTGSRLTHSFMRIGGVPEDLPDGWVEKCRKVLDDIEKRAIPEYNDLITGNEIFLARTKNTGVATKEQAIDWGWSGPNLRASGVPYDLRKDEPYSVYDRFEFNVPVGENGDNFDRYYMRVLEITESIKIIRQALEMLPEGPIMAKVPKVIKPPAGEAFTQYEQAKGNLGFYIVSDGSTKPYRMRIYSPCFVALGLFPTIGKGCLIQDTVVTLAGIDIVLGEVDR